MSSVSGLYGIHHSNRSVDEHWGKNRFNSSYPAATAAYMLDHDIPAIYLKLQNNKGKLEVVTETISLRDVFNIDVRSLDEIYYSFESVYEPYQKYAFDAIDGIDLVIKDMAGNYLAPLEVKLTVLPDSTTVNRDESEWGSELVVRSATTSYCALGMFSAVEDDADDIRNIFEDSCSSVQMWDNDFEMTHKTAQLKDCIDTFECRYIRHQKPLLMQTVWKTQGQSPVLAEQAFDIVVWSDYAFSRLFLDKAVNGTRIPDRMSRHMRSTARLARCLWELSKSGKIRLTDIYRQMSYRYQTDKEFAISGSVWRTYIDSVRTITPVLHKDVVLEIIEDGNIERLRPERRFDQTLYFTARNKR